MNDEIGALLSRYLKNWAARNPPPADIRERLLKKAAASPLEREHNKYRYVDYDFRGAELQYHNSGSWLLGPFTQSRLWSFHVATTFRMAT